MKLTDVLGTGECNAILGAQLIERYGFASVRELRLQVERERAEGAAILAGQRGYFLPQRDENGRLTQQGAADVKRFYRLQMAKGRGTIMSAKSARIALKEYEQRNQTSIPGV